MWNTGISHSLLVSLTVLAAWLSKVPAAAAGSLLVSAASRDKRNVSNGKNVQQNIRQAAQAQLPQQYLTAAQTSAPTTDRSISAEQMPLQSIV